MRPNNSLFAGGMLFATFNFPCLTLPEIKVNGSASLIQENIVLIRTNNLCGFFVSVLERLVVCDAAWFDVPVMPEGKLNRRGLQLRNMRQLPQ